VTERAQYLGRLKDSSAVKPCMARNPSANCFAILPNTFWTSGNHRQCRINNAVSLKSSIKLRPKSLGRQPDFDPQLDSMVRVQAGRLRAKLAEYYASEGAADHVWVELPKGTYVLSFHPGATAAVRNHGGALGRSRHESAPLLAKRLASGNDLRLVLSVLLAAAVAGLAALLVAEAEKMPTLKGEHRKFSRYRGDGRAFHLFWKAFLPAPKSPG